MYSLIAGKKPMKASQKTENFARIISNFSATGGDNRMIGRR
jgi:hypothetical protein